MSSRAEGKLLDAGGALVILLACAALLSSVLVMLRYEDRTRPTPGSLLLCGSPRCCAPVAYYPSESVLCKIMQPNFLGHVFYQVGCINLRLWYGA